jgi:hypothetical protein
VSSAHRVRLVNDDRGRQRAQCITCPWASPWRTVRSAWADGPNRSENELQSIIERAAEWHIYAEAR